MNGKNKTNAESESKVLLGVNIDHIATVRQARGEEYPRAQAAAKEALAGGADFITVHLREDRRHIQDSDLPLVAAADANWNLEIAATEEMLLIAAAAAPRSVCIVPERREELTTEGGLNARAQETRLRDFCEKLREGGMETSLFIDPEKEQIAAAAQTGADAVELHTGAYARDGDIAQLQKAAEFAAKKELQVNAGHGLRLENAAAVAALPQIAELNIGHFLIARALFIGLRAAVAEMSEAIKNAR